MEKSVSKKKKANPKYSPFWMDEDEFDPKLMYEKLSDRYLTMADCVILLRRTVLYLLSKELKKEDV